MFQNSPLRRTVVPTPRAGSAVVNRVPSSSQPTGGARVRTPLSLTQSSASHPRTSSSSSPSQVHHSRSISAPGNEATQAILRRRTSSISESNSRLGGGGTRVSSVAGSRSRDLVPPRGRASTPQQPGRVATVSEVRAIEARLTRLEEQRQSGSGDGSSQESGFSASHSQRAELTQFGRNASGGPSAPPEPKAHEAPGIKLHFRRLVYLGYGGVKTGAELVRQPYPATGHWPKHPPSVIEDEEDDDDARLTRGNQIRLHLIRPYRDPVNQGQLRKTFRYMLGHRRQCGVPMTMTLEELVASCASTFKGWRKAGGRSNALRLHRYYFFSDGTKVAKPSKGRAVGEASNVRRSAVRADLEFAVQPYAMSDEEDERTAFDVPDEADWSDDGPIDDERPGTSVRRRIDVPWRSQSLVQKLEELEKQRARVRKPTKPILPPNRHATVPLNFSLPSSIRRWMVAKSWAAANKDACLNVSDNAGPFQGKYSVTTGPMEWGPDPDWELDVETDAIRDHLDDGGEDGDEDLDLHLTGDEDDDDDFDLPGFDNNADKGGEDDELDDEDDEEEDDEDL